MTDAGVNGLLAVAAVLVLLLVWLLVHHVAYKARHPYTEEDVRSARKQAIIGSQRTRGGQAAEQLAPSLPVFCERFNPKDARFLGNPVDFVVFAGLEEGEVREVVFLEIKSGSRNDLNKNERRVRRAVEDGRVRFEVLKSLSDAQPSRPAIRTLDRPAPTGECPDDEKGVGTS